MHLDPKVIEALEADRFAQVGASVYVRGHLKRYADFIGEPGAELVSMYSTRETRAATPDLTQVPHPERRADPRRLVTPLVALVTDLERWPPSERARLMAVIRAKGGPSELAYLRKLDRHRRLRAALGALVGGGRLP